MFCEECGAKNNKNATFCEECGHNLKGVAKEEKKEKVEGSKIKEESKVVKKSTKKAVVKEEVKPIVEEKKVNEVVSVPKKKSNLTLILILISVVILSIGGVLIYGYFMTTPEAVTDKLLKAYSYNDYEIVYDFVGVPNKEFTKKEKFLEDAPEKYEEPEFEYLILETKIDGDTATVEYKVDKDIFEVELKRDGNKFLVFPNWTLDVDGLLEEDFKVYALKDSKIKIDDVDIERYYDKELSDDEMDVYVIDYILSSATYDIEVEYPFGFVIEDEFSPYDELDLTYFDEDDIDSDTEEAIVDVSVSYIEEIYEHIIDDNSWSDIEDDYKYDFEDDYEETYENITDYYILSEAKVLDEELIYLSMTDGMIEVTIEGDLEYEASFDFDSSDKFSGERTDLYFTIYLKYDDGDYELAGIEYLPSYFPSN